jgi:predicted PurR-regulated permease PerM
MLAVDYPLLNIFWTISIVFMWGAWIFTVIWVFMDNFRRRDHGGGAKALWTLVIIFVPVFGVLVYLIARPDVEVA